MMTDQKTHEENQLLATFMGICLYDQQFQWADKPFQYHISPDGLFPVVNKVLETGGGGFSFHKEGAGDWLAAIEQDGHRFECRHASTARAVHGVLVKYLTWYNRTKKGGMRHGR